MAKGVTSYLAFGKVFLFYVHFAVTSHFSLLFQVDDVTNQISNIQNVLQDDIVKRVQQVN